MEHQAKGPLNLYLWYNTIMEDLKRFLIEAKKNTYANAKAKKVASSRPGSKDYEYTDGTYIYHDTYFGKTFFIGEEVVYKVGEEKPIWGMNYYGITLDEDLADEAVAEGLRPALMLVGEDDTIPVRGPKSFKNGNYSYSFEAEGDLSSFSGLELIYKAGKKICELKCFGGKII